MNSKKRIDVVTNVNRPRIQLEAGLNEVSVAQIRSTITKKNKDA